MIWQATSTWPLHKMSYARGFGAFSGDRGDRQREAPERQEKTWRQLEEAQDIFNQAYIVDQKNDGSGTVSRHRLVPGPALFRHFRDSAQREGRKRSPRHGLDGKRKKKSKAMPKTSKKNPKAAKAPTADKIAEMASRGEVFHTL
jgi:hypothetical protein